MSGPRLHLHLQHFARRSRRHHTPFLQCHRVVRDRNRFLGRVRNVDERHAEVVANAEQETSVRGVYAAGDITRFAHNATFAIADGVMTAMAIHRSLVFGQQRP